MARDWQREVGVPNAPPTFLGPRAAGGDRRDRSAEGPERRPVGIDPLAPRYKEWDERAASSRPQETSRPRRCRSAATASAATCCPRRSRAPRSRSSSACWPRWWPPLIGTCSAPSAGFFGGKVGDFLEWLYNVFEAIPDILLIFAFAAVFGRGIGTVVLILGLTGWTGMYRQVRAEFIKHRGREYVRAAEAIGASTGSRMFRHILPNVSHVILVRMCLLVVGFIKAEVILSYLGLGVPVDQVSWGTMLAEAQSELILGHWWQLAAATRVHGGVRHRVLADGRRLRDALDPKLRGAGVNTMLLSIHDLQGRLPHGRARRGHAAPRRSRASASTSPRTPPSRWSANRARARA